MVFKLRTYIDILWRFRTVHPAYEAHRVCSLVFEMMGRALLGGGRPSRDSVIRLLDMTARE
jgi:hypothetical protein